MDINLYTPNSYSFPVLIFARFDYDDMSDWDAGVSPASHYGIFNPLYQSKDFIDYRGDSFNLKGKVIDTDTADMNYWGLRQVVGKALPLTDINSQNMYDIVLGTFDKLSRK